jgi:hypothetical protein
MRSSKCYSQIKQQIPKSIEMGLCTIDLNQRASVDADEVLRSANMSIISNFIFYENLTA